MKTYLLFILSAITLFGCSTQNPSPNTNNSNNYSYTQGANLIDADGNVYPTFITSCGQTWMQKNLDVSHYRNGDVIPQVTDPATWTNLTTGAWCYYNNDPALGAVYGKLYNWYAVNDSRGLAPSGWHVPSESDWSKFVKCIDHNADTTYQNWNSTSAGGALKEAGTSHWIAPNTGATNTSGFGGLPAGMRYNYDGHFNDIGYTSIWWSSTEDNTNYAWGHLIDYDSEAFGRNDGPLEFKKNGFSVRCIKD